MPPKLQTSELRLREQNLVFRQDAHSACPIKLALPVGLARVWSTLEPCFYLLMRRLAFQYLAADLLWSDSIGVYLLGQGVAGFSLHNCIVNMH